MLALALALFTVFVLTACGDGDEERTVTESPAVVSSLPPTAAPTSSATPVPTATATATSPPPTATIVPQLATPTKAPPTATARPEPTVRPTSQPTATPRPTAEAQPTTGTVEVRVTDAPPEGVSAIVLTLSEIEAHDAGAADEKGWITLIEDERTFDLVKVEGLEKLLGSTELPTGDYTQVRMKVLKAVVTLDVGSGDEEREATVPSDRLRVVGRFTVEEDAITILVLDFDAEKSVVVTGAGRVQVKPVVKLLVRQKGDAAATQPVQVLATPTETPAPPTATATPVPTPTVTATPEPTATPLPTLTPTATPDAFAEAHFLDILFPLPDVGEQIAFVVQAQITLEGRSRIDATVSVGDEFVELDEDGRFEIQVDLELGIL